MGITNGRMKRGSARAFAGAALLVSAATLLSGCAPEPPRTPPTAEAADSTNPGQAAREADSATDPGAAPDTQEEPANPGLSQEALDEQLRSAAWANDVDAASRLIRWGANSNAKDSIQQSPYLVATSEGRVELLELTLAHGADLGDLDSWNGTGLIRAAERGHWEVSGTLIQHGVAVDHVNRLGYQAIHEAVILGRDDPSYHLTLLVLVAGGASLVTPSVNEGMTPIQMAYHRGFTGQIAVLEALDAPAPADPDGALFEAAAAGDPNAVALAIRAGADVAAPGGDGRTARLVAEEAGHFRAASVLRALGG